MSPKYMLVLLMALVLAVSSLAHGPVHGAVHPRPHPPPKITRYSAPHIHKPKPPNVATTNTYAAKKPPIKPPTKG
ncbi:hypothetical protein AAZX31_08G123300 [Glycine max]|nr:hypothetical protein GYH30_021051 [Glycine max]